MAFYENNIQRIRNDLKHLLTEDDIKNFMPCSKKSMCTIQDMISSIPESNSSDSDIKLGQDVEKDGDVYENKHVDGEHNVDRNVDGDNDVDRNVDGDNNVDRNVDGEHNVDRNVDGDNDVDRNVDGDNDVDRNVDGDNDVDRNVDGDNDVDVIVDVDKDGNVDKKICNTEELKITLPPIDDTDSENEEIEFNSDYDSNTEDSDVENFKEIEMDMNDSDYETELNIIRENETKLKRLKTNYFTNESVPIKYEDDDEFVNNLIRRELEDKQNYDKSYEENSNEENSDEEKEVNKYCDKKYNNFEAFYENYITNNQDFEQLKVFNKIIANNLVQHPFLNDVMNQFREDIIEKWITKFKQAQKIYQFANFDSKKWIKRAENFIFNSKLKKPIIEYLHSIGALMVLFDVDLTFNLNKHLYKNIEFESIKPLNLKREIYNANELVQYHNYGKDISNILIQDIIDNISLNQNINIMNLDIDLYNRIFQSKLNKLDECIEPDIQKKVNQYILKDNHFSDLLKQPIIYIDPDTHHVYIFEYNKLCKNFDEKNYVNPHTNKPFEQEFIEQCLEKMKNINLCNYCKDNCSKQTLKTIYQDPNFGPIILKFCSVDCFSDIEWKPKVLLNTII